MSILQARFSAKAAFDGAQTTLTFPRPPALEPEKRCYDKLDHTCQTAADPFSQTPHHAKRAATHAAQVAYRFPSLTLLQRQQRFAHVHELGKRQRLAASFGVDARPLEQLGQMRGHRSAAGSAAGEVGFA